MNQKRDPNNHQDSRQERKHRKGKKSEGGFSWSDIVAFCLALYRILLPQLLITLLIALFVVLIVFFIFF